MIKVVFMVRSLDCGGAERQLLTLAHALDRKLFEPTILTFYSGGVLEAELSDQRVRLVSLNKTGRWDMFGFLARMFRELRRLRPDIIHSYLDFPNILTVLMKPLCAGPPIVWGIRSTVRDFSQYDWLRRFGFWLEQRLGHFPDRIIVNSGAGYRYLLSSGYPPAKLALIH